VVQSCIVNFLRLDVRSPSNARFRRLARQLQALADLEVEYEMVIEAICSSSSCTNAQDVGNSLYNQVTNDLRAVIEDGSLVSNLIASSSDISQILEAATASGDFSEVVIPILALLSDWYPDWRGGSNTCKNDGNAPYYMKVSGTFYESSLGACCERFYSWDLDTCAGDSGTVPSGYYPNWGGSSTKCMNTTNTMPEHMRRNPEQWLYDDIASCCDHYYHWAYTDCRIASGESNAISLATGKWYICQQDCPDEEGGGPCGGFGKSDTLYDSVEACCKDKLSWIPSATCQAQSTLLHVAGSSLWFVDWAIGKADTNSFNFSFGLFHLQCVKDCVVSSEPDCGGMAQKWDQLFTNSNDCCDRIWWTDRAGCTG
ncbi:hypothetical protein ACHAXR_001742, partial [Thalassiosira sp. AJA248-18]